MRKILFQQAVICLCFLFVFSSCDGEDSFLEITEYSSEYNISIINNDTVAYPVIADNKLSEEDYKIAKVFENFAMQKLDEYSADLKNNFVFSPFNASLTFSLMNNATNEKEQKVINKYLGLNDSHTVDKANNYNRKVISKIQKDLDSKGSECCMSNKIWVKNDSKIYRSFVSTLNSYKAKIEGVDFKFGKDKIEQYVQNNSNYGDASLFFAYDEKMNAMFSNSIRFSMRWNIRNSTYENESFIKENGEVISCQKIGGYGKFNYMDCGYYSITEIPCIDSDYSMYLIYTPCSDLSFYNTLNNIIYRGGIDECISRMEKENVKLKFPKFSVESTMSLIENEDVDLKVYSKVSPNKFTLNSLSQICNLEVDENGISAKVTSSGSVGGYMKPTSDMLDWLKRTTSKNNPNTENIEYIDNEISSPFWFVVRNNKFKSIVFAGCIKDV